MSKFFKKSFYYLKPDILLVMGDVSARGSTLTRGKWVSVLHQFHRVLGPFIELPFHVVLGDRDVGGCSGLDANSVYWIARSFPGLDSSGCGAFDIDNVSFVSLNAVALLCGNNKLRFSVEKAVEMERIGSWMETEKEMDDYGEFTKMSDAFGRRENAVSSGLGPVLLLHFPLHRAANGGCKERNIVRKAHVPLGQGLNALESSRGFTGAGSYDLLHTIPPNATEYIFQALKPRIVFSAHTHEFCDHTHSDGTREITVPAMTWKARDDPGFVFATFRSGGNAVSVSYCSLARESHVLIAYTLILLLLLVSCLWLVHTTGSGYHGALFNMVLCQLFTLSLHALESNQHLSTSELCSGIDSLKPGNFVDVGDE
ncbi:unnamed protein product [Dovyalis caffra]|uniref:Metallophosphoesterase 1 n=1 Tax=Dovyalis caffra TaxID=77055 RepID=A0AAV1SA30_9ROSI|nr:unnamed protein product [Dovyalis caffra]